MLGAIAEIIDQTKIACYIVISMVSLHTAIIYRA